MKLMILESGAKARTIKKYLGRGWIVDACNGHVQDLPNNGGTKQDSKAMWAAKPNELPNPPWSWTGRAERVITAIRRKASAKNVEEIYIATDPDREGEFIAWRLKELLNDLGVIKRVSFNEITKSAVQSAIDDPRDIDMDLVDAAKVRRFMDRLVGFRCSRFCRSWSLVSMGRVQTPTLGFIVERELEREAHVPIPYHSVQAVSDGVTFKVRFHEKEEAEAWRDGDGKHHPDRTSDTDLASDAFAKIEAEGSIVLDEVKEGQTNRKPKPPFTTDTMLRAASSRMGWSIARTNRVATGLYQSGHITYIRTDSTRTNKGARERIRKLILKEFGENHLGTGIEGPDAKKGAKNVQDAHEAIRPTNPENRSIAELDADGQSLYRLIWGRFAASQMSDSIREKRNLVGSVPDLAKPLHGTASWRIHAGWEAVYSDSKDTIRTQPPDTSFEIGTVWGFTAIEDNPNLITDETKPPRRFTESSIIQEMKRAGIGRPSTYPTTVTKLIDREYIIKDGSSLTPTDSGRTLWIEVVPHYVSDNDSRGSIPRGIFTPDFTALMELNLDHVETGRSSGPDIWHSFVEEFRMMHNQALETRKLKPTPRQLNYIHNRMSRMSDVEKKNLLGGRDFSELSGQDARKLIDTMNENGGGEIPASDKQIAFIVRLMDRLKLDLDEFLTSKGHDDLQGLTGGRGGTASSVISTLIDMDKDSPATEKQITTIQSMCENLELSIPDAMALVDTTTIDEISKSDASNLIDRLKKTIQSRKKKKNKRN